MDTASLRVKPFTPGELQIVSQITHASFGYTYPPEFFLEVHRRFPDMFLVAESSMGAVGYVMSTMEHQQTWQPVAWGHILSVAVFQAWRHLGIGRTLIEETLAAIKNYPASGCYLEVKVSNPAAINLYAKLGFRIVSRIPYYYPDGRDGYVMALPFIRP